MIDGILNLNKPPGPTSHDVVAKIRRITHQRRVGHAGTLDPMATGVLIICLGRATRMAEYLMDSRKIYRARVRLGVTTNTYDAEGKVVDEAPVTVGREDVEAAFEYVRVLRPDASRDSSSEVYVVGKGRLTTDLRPGDELAVAITDVGDEGDGIAYVDGYTLFVEGADVGDEPTVEVTDVKPRFGFAELVDE